MKYLLKISSFYTWWYFIWGTVPEIRSKTEFLCHFRPFFPLLTRSLLTTQKTKVLKKWKKHLEMSSFETCATKNTIWCMLTQIWSALTDLMFCHFRSFSALLPHYWARKLKFRKNVKKILEILSFYTRVPLLKIIYTLDMMYGSWYMKFKRQSYFVILGHFLPFSPLTAWKMKISKIKKPPKISSFYIRVPEIMIRCYAVPEILRMSNVIVIVHFLQFLAVLLL